MKKNIFAFTAMNPEQPSYPGYVSINREPSGDVTVSVRSEPRVEKDRSYICGFAKDKGAPGRCTPGDERCNNYCNMAPEKGPMQDHPLPCTQVFAGSYASFTVPAAEWEKEFGCASS